MQTFDWIACIALLIAMSSLGISLRDHIRDRYKLRCDAYMLWEGDEEGLNIRIVVSITNEGRRPVSITQIHFEEDQALADQRGTYAIRSSILGGSPDRLEPVELMESQARRFISKSMTRAEAMLLPRVVEIVVKDSRDKTYYISLPNESRDD